MWGEGDLEGAGFIVRGELRREEKQVLRLTTPKLESA